MTLLAVAPDLEPISILRGLDPVEVQAHYGCALVYLLHMDTPFVVNGYAWRHYIGSTRPGKLADRMIVHRTGTDGAKLLQLARARGITWHLARVWPVPDGSGRYAEERRIKRMGGASRSCPSCGIVPGHERPRGPDGRYVTTRRTT